MPTLFDSIVSVEMVACHLKAHHYLGPARRGFAWVDEYGVAVLANPTSRRLPPHTWLEITRWCLNGEPNSGSRQFARIKKWLINNQPHITTLVSYSDRSVGHTGSLYRACNWLPAPTWQRLRPPPSGGGSWDGQTRQEPKDRWVYPLRPDPERPQILSIKDASIVKKYPNAEYREPQFRGLKWSYPRNHKSD